ncbi:MAG: MmgE/PrpD family protein [Pseudomonadales bacterium]
MKSSKFDQPTRQIAKYAVDLKSDTLSRSAIESTVWHLLDSIGCALGAQTSHSAAVARKIASTATSNAGASVIGLTTKTTPELAAFSNTVMIRHLDYNDTGIGGHPSDMIPSILAVAEAKKSSGQKTIKAIFAAYEVVACIRRAGLYGNSLRKKHIDQVQSVLGSVVGAGIILDLEFEQMANAISLALTPNIPMRVVRTGELSDWKGCATAHCSMMAVFAARLAKEGLTGPEKPFEGVAGLNDLIDIGPLDLADLGQINNRLSAVESTCFKLYPSEYSSQGPIGNILRLRQEINPEEIESITIELHWAGWQEIGGGQGDKVEKWNPTTRESADHSLPYLVAVALADGKITLDSFTDERISDPRLRPMMKKINVIESSEMTKEHAGELPKWPSIIEVILHNGQRIRRHSGIPRGHPLNPLDRSELKGKFMNLGCRSIPKNKANNFFETIMQLGELGDINVLTKQFRFD